MTREVTTHRVNGLNEALRIEVLDGPGKGNACHRYLITDQFGVIQEAMMWLQKRTRDRIARGVEGYNQK